MDPNITLNEMRTLIETASPFSPFFINDMIAAVHAYQDLDGWISKGGALPDGWTHQAHEAHRSSIENLSKMLLSKGVPSALLNRQN